MNRRTTNDLAFTRWRRAGGGSVEAVSLERFPRSRAIYIRKATRHFGADEVFRGADVPTPLERIAEAHDLI